MSARDQVAAAIRSVAARLGVDPNLALATAEHESSLDPTAVGDYGTSFGVFQLHRGGELGNLTPQQAFDPVTNATVALTEISKVAKAHPSWSPGQIAAAAQRPDKPAKYAAAVNALYAKLTGGKPPTGSPSSSGGWAGDAMPGSGSSGGTSSPAGFPLGGVDVRSLLIEALAVTAGLSLVVVGLATAARKPAMQAAQTAGSLL